MRPGFAQALVRIPGRCTSPNLRGAWRVWLSPGTNSPLAGLASKGRTNCLPRLPVMADFVAKVGDLSCWASVGLLRPSLIIRCLEGSASDLSLRALITQNRRRLLVAVERAVLQADVDS